MNKKPGSNSDSQSQEGEGIVNSRPHVVVIGAGLAGLAAATRLKAGGFHITVLEKSRGPGGRMSTRREPVGQFNHGAQYFTCSDPGFKTLVADAVQRGVLQEWQARIGVIDSSGVRPASAGTRRYVGIPGMNALCRNLAAQLEDVRFDWTVTGMEYSQDGWLIRKQDGEILEADSVVLTVPPEQARQLLPAKVLGNLLDSIHMHPCWAVMAVLDRPLLEDFDAVFVNSGPLSWLASQPGSAANSHAWILHASAEWSQLHLEQDPGWVSTQLLQEAKNFNASTDLNVVWSKAHRWRYCMARKPLQAGSLSIPGYKLVLAGDWCHGSKVEGAYLSGMAAADSLLGSPA